MADRIELAKGDLPWQPKGSDNPHVLNNYDMPLSGIIDQHGAPYFFWCLRGEVTQGSLWGYAPLGEHERLEFANEPRDQILRRLLATRRPYTIAFSIDGHGIVKWRDVDELPVDGGSATFRIVAGEEQLDLTPEERSLLDTV